MEPSRSLSRLGIRSLSLNNAYRDTTGFSQGTLSSVFYER